MSARRAKPMKPVLLPVEVATVRQQPWAANFGGRAIKVLAAAGIATDEHFLAFEPSWDVSYSVSREIRHRQYDLRIERGLLDPVEPMTPEGVQDTLRSGGVLFEGECAFVSLGSYRAPEGKYYRLEGGDIYLEDVTPRYPSNRELKGYHTIYHSPSSKVDKTYGIMRRLGFEERKFDVELTRRIYGMEFDALEELVVGYGIALRHDLGPHPYLPRCTERITCSLQSNGCDLTGNLIPDNFPYVTTTESMYWGGHISIAAFYNHVKLLTGHADKRYTATRLMTEAGVGAQTWHLLKTTGTHGIRPHVRRADVIDLLHR
jgi:hypothetical protein